MQLLTNLRIKIVLGTLAISLFGLSMASCTKETIIERVVTDTVEVEVEVIDTVDSDAACPLRGLYVGMSTKHNGETANSIYEFRDNHFVVGYHEVGQAGQAFGGFRNTCDSVIFNVYYKFNDKYYLHKGKYSNNRSTISGTFQNLDVPTDHGTFTMTK